MEKIDYWEALLSILIIIDAFSILFLCCILFFTLPWVFLGVVGFLLFPYVVMKAQNYYVDRKNNEK